MTTGRRGSAARTGCFACRVLRAFAFGGIGGAAAGAAALQAGVPRSELALWIFLGAMAAVVAGTRLLGGGAERKGPRAAP